MKKTLAERFVALTCPEPNTGCLLWLGSIHRVGYGQFWDGTSMKGAHRVAYELANGPIPEGIDICHVCDVRSCVNVEHMFLGYHRDNMADMASKGRACRGSASPLSKLDEEAVREVKSRLRCGETKARIARDLRVSHGCIQAIAVGISWRHIS